MHGTAIERKSTLDAGSNSLIYVKNTFGSSTRCHKIVLSVMSNLSRMQRNLLLHNQMIDS